MSSYVVSECADNVSDDVFVSPAESHHGAGYMLPPSAAGPPPHAPSPTGYRDYVPPAEAYSYSRATPDLQPVHKTILLGDSGVGKTSLLVQFDQGKFQTGTFSATVGIGFTVNKFRILIGLSACMQT